MKRITIILAGLLFSLCGLVFEETHAEWKLVLPSGLILVYPDNSTKAKNSKTSQSPHKQKKEFTPQKSYNWIKPNPNKSWQCAYELTYHYKKPDGFKLYVDINGDNRIDYRYKYTLQDINGFFGGATYDFELDTKQVPVGGGWKNNLYSAMNVCGIDAIKRLFYQRDDLVERPSKYEITEMDLDIYYPQITFERR